MHRCLLRIFELGQQQRSDLWTAHGTARAISLAACRPLEVGHAVLAAALATLGAAEAALGRCRRLLPYGWVQQMETQIGLSRRLLPAARDQLRLLQQQGGASRGPAGTAGAQASGAAQRAFLAEQREDAERLLQPPRHLRRLRAGSAGPAALLPLQAGSAGPAALLALQAATAGRFG